MYTYYSYDEWYIKYAVQKRREIEKIAPLSLLLLYKPHHLNKIWRHTAKNVCGLCQFKPQAKTCCVCEKLSIHYNVDRAQFPFCLVVHYIYFATKIYLYIIHRNVYIAIALAIHLWEFVFRFRMVVSFFPCLVFSCCRTNSFENFSNYRKNFL